MPIVGDGPVHEVVGVDVRLSDLSDFMNVNRASPGSVAFIADRSGSVIAYHDTEVLRREEGELVRISNR